MNQKIFTLDLSIKAVSAYLLCCSLADSARPISVENLLDIWNDTERALLESLKDLEDWKIVQIAVPGGPENRVYRLTDPQLWAKPAP